MSAQKTAANDYSLKVGLAEMLKGGVIMDVVTPEQARIAEDAGAVAVMALERVPSDIREGFPGPSAWPCDLAIRMGRKAEWNLKTPLLTSIPSLYQSQRYRLHLRRARVS